MADADVYVHIADDGGILVIEGSSGKSAWVTLDDLARRLELVRNSGGSLVLSRERNSPIADPVLALVLRSGVSIVEALEPHRDAVREGGLTAVMSAAYLGALGLLLDLVTRGADLRAGDEDGFTALMYAANAGEGECTAVLLAHGADVNQVDRQGSTALMFAAQHGHLSLVKQLAAAGASVTTRNATGMSARDFAEAHGHRRVAGVLLSIEERVR